MILFLEKFLKKLELVEFVKFKSIEIGEIMMNALKEVDSVAYVRFASVL
jgi:Predicted transcriptional regulator, consists of a Zn-ribbon and ATP-cone domains